VAVWWCGGGVVVRWCAVWWCGGVAVVWCFFSLNVTEILSEYSSEVGALADLPG
jgi:hypothetical protein